jgi:hypothetical protein
MAVTGLWTLLFPALRNADRLTPESLRNLTSQESEEVPQL